MSASPARSSSTPSPCWSASRRPTSRSRPPTCSSRCRGCRSRSARAFADAEGNRAALRTLEQEATLQDGVVQSAPRSLELTTNQYQAGIVSYLNVTTAQPTAYNAESTAVNVLGRRLTAAVGLV